ncbi:MAG: 50S ribosomal protein L11 methyltransferase [Thermodesulfobacteriota bacterium]
MKTHRTKRRNSGFSEPLFFDVGDGLRLIPFRARGLSRSDRLEIVIDPGASFGVGDHPTTTMALELIEAVMPLLRASRHLPSLLDIGTGTGVLAVAGKLLGAGFTVAVDTDPVAVASAKRNFILNGLDCGSGQESGVDLVVGGAESIGGAFDLVVANLVAPVLIRIHEQLTSRTGAWLILSGIADVMADAVAARYDTGRVRLVSRKQRDGWNGMLYERL